MFYYKSWDGTIHITIMCDTEVYGVGIGLVLLVILLFVCRSKKREPALLPTKLESSTFTIDEMHERLHKNDEDDGEYSDRDSTSPTRIEHSEL